jgi:hypothetical protein
MTTVHNAMMTTPPYLSPDDDCDDGTITTPTATMSNKSKQWNRVYYFKKNQPMHQPQRPQQQ